VAAVAKPVLEGSPPGAVYTATTGKHVVSGKSLSPGERLLTVVFIAPFKALKAVLRRFVGKKVPTPPVTAAKPPPAALKPLASVDTAVPLADDVGRAAGRTPRQLLPGLRVSSKQFGHKVGKHAVDFGLDPKNADHRQWVRTRIEDIVGGYDVV